MIIVKYRKVNTFRRIKSVSTFRSYILEILKRTLQNFKARSKSDIVYAYRRKGTRQIAEGGGFTLIIMQIYILCGHNVYSFVKMCAANVYEKMEMSIYAFLVTSL